MRVGILQTLGLGDFLTSLPAIRAIRRHYPHAELVWIGKAEYLSLIEPIFDGVFDLRALTDPREIPACDVAINLHGSGPLSHGRLYRSRQIIAFFNERYAPNGPTWSKVCHIRQLWIDLLSHYGIPGDANDFLLGKITCPSSEVIVHVDARDRDRWWPLERFEQVIRTLCQVTVIGERLGKPRSLQETTMLIASASLVIGADSGVSHLAYAYQRPTITLFGPAPAQRWGPPLHSRHVILGNYFDFDEIKPLGPCSPHLLAVSANDLLYEVEKSLIHH